MLGYPIHTFVLTKKGGFRKVYELGIEKNWLPVRLAAAGYNSYLVGKYLNEYFEHPSWMRPGTNYYSPEGWTVFDALTVNAYNLTNSCFSLNGSPTKCFPGQYQTDLIRDKALGYLDDAAAAHKPFMFYLAPTAPHRVSTNKMVWYPPTPAARHANLYPGIKAPVTPNWGLKNPALPRPQAKLDAAYNASMNALYGDRLRSLRAVDEMLDAVVNRLQTLGLLDNTYVIFASDNGCSSL
ncbi:Arylsulfatase [Tetrabaena socialis]|uniref:Arylsulfatase n=1 Tax=Tetrabaena socialis TaxID=47790 RepID=A0A2J8AEK8_9CHLO|nr:Arylsulfatase [Tetrabaena socialis]|eukprot:PNH10957.1 Arylsulfatase [Tetrabaena socialis]